MKHLVIFGLGGVLVSSTGLARAIQPHLASFKGEVGLYVRHLGSGEDFAHHADVTFLTASVFKIAVLVELFRQVDSGQRDMEHQVRISRAAKLPGSGVLKELADDLVVSVRDLAILMIVVSDNTATDLLLDLVGKEAVNATLGQLRLERTRVDFTCREILYNLLDPDSASMAESDVTTWRKWRINPKSKSLTDLEHNNVSTPREMGKFLESIHDGHAATPTACAAILSILKRQQVNDRIPLLLPRSVEVAHKTGELPGIRNDAGIVYASAGPYLFVCFTRRLPSEGEGCWNIGQLSRAAFDYFGSQH